MIIVDYSGLAIAGIMSQLKGSKEIEVDLARHFLLNMIRSINSKHRNEYGELILAIDSRKYWRKEVFPYYKANRKKARDESGFDWAGLFNAMQTIKEELVETFPYKVIEVERAEADDIIGALCKEYGNTNEKILIVATDSDYNQLLHYMNVNQLCPLKGKMVQANAKEALINKIIKGDKKDGVPSIKQDDNALVLGTRAPPINQAFIAELKAMKDDHGKYERNWKRNEQLLDLEYIPDDLYNEIIKSVNEYPVKNKAGLMDYFAKHKLRNLFDKLHDF